MKHPSEIQLALWAGHDLGVWSRWRVGAHVAHCAVCSAEVQAHQSGSAQLRELASVMPEHINWTRLAPEMTGNIRVGLAAGECIAGFQKGPRALTHKLLQRRLGWHAAAVLGCATVVVITALWLSLPKSEFERMAGSLQRIRVDRLGKVVRAPALLQDGIVLEASPFSIAIRENGGTMSLLQPRPVNPVNAADLARPIISVNMQGSAGARYVDAESGQVTTNRVYYAQ